MLLYVFFFRKKTAYELRISDWSSDVCSSDLGCKDVSTEVSAPIDSNPLTELIKSKLTSTAADGAVGFSPGDPVKINVADGVLSDVTMVNQDGKAVRSEEHTSELQSLMRISYAVFCLKKKKNK